MADEQEGSVRSQIAGGLAGWATEAQIRELIDNVLAIKKKASAEFACKKCKQRQMQWAEIPDARSVAQALKDLLAEGFGRPQGEESGERIVFERVIYMEPPDGDSAEV